MKLRRLLYWKLARLCTLQDLVHIDRRPPKQVVIIRRIRDQSAGLDVLAEGIDGGQFALDRELRDAAALAHQKSVRRRRMGCMGRLGSRFLNGRQLVRRGAGDSGRLGRSVAVRRMSKTQFWLRAK